MNFLTTQKILAGVLLIASAAWPAPAHHAFFPVPDEKLRPLAADRPDATESPQTVDAGRFQLEIDIAAYVKEKGDEAISVLATNLKWGLLPSVDLQLGFTPFLHSRSDSGSGTSTDDGISNFVVRVKVNLWGNDGETTTALALLPFVSIPSDGSSLDDDEVTGGLVVPFGTSLGAWGFSAQVGIEWVRNEADDGYDVEFSQTVVLGRDIHGPWAVFFEIASVVPERGGWQGSFNSGLTYAATQNLQLDLGVSVGFVSEADDFVVFIGVTRRF